MEPLTGFFILEGLTFDIIGVYLIVTGLFELKKIQLSEEHRDYWKLLKERLIEIPNQKEGYANMVVRPDYFQKISKKSQFEYDTLEAIEDLSYKTDRNYQQNIQGLNKGRTGLPFLVGGFLLQAIAVITQLFN